MGLTLFQTSSCSKRVKLLTHVYSVNTIKTVLLHLTDLSTVEHFSLWKMSGRRLAFRYPELEQYYELFETLGSGKFYSVVPIGMECPL